MALSLQVAIVSLQDQGSRQAGLERTIMRITQVITRGDEFEWKKGSLKELNQFLGCRIHHQ